VDRTTLIDQIGKRLGKVQLVWFGTRGDDVEAARDIDALGAAFSIISTYDRRSSVHSLALEDSTQVRVDLDTYDIDDELESEAVREMRRTMFRVLARPSAVFTYRPSTFVSSICFARRDRCRYLGMFKDHQAAFEHKPWVETCIADLGLPHIGWTYVADEDQLDALYFLRDGPVMLRPSRTNGGVGLVLLENPGQLSAIWPEQVEAYASVAPYIADAIPVNVGGVVWHDGVTVHPASVQLIGIPGCTSRPFGYCGNDFGAVGDLDAISIGAVEQGVLQIGRWLRAHGYLGAFGVDFLVKDGVPLFTEVNPRFQGSTHASCQISVESDEGCILLEHLGALLGLDAPRYRSLTDQARSAPEIAHIVVHWTGTTPTSIDPASLLDGFRNRRAPIRADVLTRPGLQTAPGGTIARITVRARLTTSGFKLVEPYAAVLRRWAEAPVKDSSARQQSTPIV